MAVGFFGPADPKNPNATLEELQRRQAYAALLQQQGGAAKPRNWHEGLSAGVSNLLGGYEEGRLNRDQAGLRKDANSQIAKLLLEGQGSPLTPTSGGGFAVPPGPSSQPSPASPAGGARAGAEIQGAGGIDPTGLDLIVRTVIAEAGGESPEGIAATAHVIKNRMASGRYGGNTAEGVVKARSQFEPWNTPEGRAKMMAYDPSSPQYQKVAAVVNQVFGGQGQDPTGGATHFYAPQLQNQLGRNAPAWAKDATATIGGHSFYAPEGRVGGGGPVTRGIDGSGVAAPVGGGGGAPAPAPAAAPSGGMSPDRRRAIVDMLTGGNPYAAQAASPIVAQLLQRDMTPPEFGFTESGGRIYRTDPRTGSVTALTDAATKPGEPFTLGEGQVRFGPDGRVVAQGPEKVPEGGKGFTLGEGQTRYDETGKPIVAGPPKRPEPPKFSDITTMRKEAADLPNVKRYSNSAPILNSMAKSIDKDDRASDLDFVYGMAQIFDPNSVVREGEQIIVKNLAGLPGEIQSVLSYVLQGGKVDKTTRRQLYDVLERRVRSYREAADVELKSPRGAAERLGVNPADIMPSLIPLAPPGVPSPGSVVRVPEGGQTPAPPNAAGDQTAPGQSEPNEPVARPLNKAEFDMLPSGMLFIAPDGSRRRKP